MADLLEGNYETRELSAEMKQSFMDYAMSVIMSRALPDVRDGLKPVHRRILYAMNELGLQPGKGYKKSARIIGEVLGKYHPHGDVALYDTMVRMAQEFSYRYTLVDGHGNFGSIDGDSAAAMRYTEVRMDKLATVLLADIEKETVDFMPNFDETLEEPKVLPARFPHLLVNGSTGIAVGMATNIPPHNLREAIDAVIALIDNPELDTDGLMKYVKGPDFPTAGIILGRDGIRKAYKTGRGSITLRGEVKIENTTGGRQQLVITELPYLVNKARMIEKIAELVREKKLDGISDLRDETDRNGIRVVIEVKRDTNPHVLLNKLYKNTQLQQNYGIIMLALVNNRPQVLTLNEILSHYIEHQREIVRRRTNYELRKAQERQHILEGFRIALDNLDKVIAIIRGSRDGEHARENLMAQLPLSRIQAQTILEMRLQRLTALERTKIEEEYTQLQIKIQYYKDILADPIKMDGVIKDELVQIRDKHSDERRTRIVNRDGDLEIEDLIADEDMVITITHQGYIKRTPVTVYRSQRRGGKGISAVTTREDDFVEHMFVTSTHNYILFFTNQGQMYKKKVYELPEASRTARGTAIVNLISLRSQEKVSAVLQVKEFDQNHFLVMATRDGYVKRTALSQYATNLKAGLIAIKLEGDDELIGVSLTDGTQQVMLFNSQGQAIRFDEKDIRVMGRATRGVRGMKLEEGASVISMATVRKDGRIVIVTDRGFGKRTDTREFRFQARGGVGVKAISLTARNGKVVAAKMIQPGDDLMIVTAKGIIIRQQADGISVLGRAAQGMTLVRIDGEDRVVAVGRVIREEPTENEPETMV
jgi:DNA gyrase subunit A